jgi:hypothetical protein
VQGVILFATLDPVQFNRFLNAKGWQGQALVSTAFPTYPAESCLLCARDPHPMPALELN